MPATIKAPLAMEAESPAMTPVQFLPSALLAWRAPIMARDGLLAKAVRKALEESIRVRQQKPTRPPQ